MFTNSILGGALFLGEDPAGPEAGLEPQGGAGVEPAMVDAKTPGKVHTDDLGDMIKDFADYPPMEPFCLLPAGYEDMPSETNTKDQTLFFPGLRGEKDMPGRFPSARGDLNTTGPFYPCVPSNSKQAAVTGSFAAGSTKSMFASSPLFSKVVVKAPEFGYSPSFP